MSNRAQREGDASISHEIDITATIGAPHAQPAWARDWNRFMNSNTHFFHAANGNKENLSAGGKAPLDPPSGEAFHTYAAWWVDANTVRFYLDDEYKFTIHPKTNYSATPFDHPMHVNMVTETYDWETPPTLEAVTNPAINTVRYDWVRAYELVPKETPTENTRQAHSL
jgi:beta-glucanase (GH16 family)